MTRGLVSVPMLIIGCGGASGDGRAFEVHETAAWVLPPGVEALGAWVRADTVMVWTASQTVLRLEPGVTPEDFGRYSAPIVAVAGEASDELRVLLESSSPQLSPLDQWGVASAGKDGGGRPTGAAWFRHAWYVAAIDSMSTLITSQLPGSSRAQVDAMAEIAAGHGELLASAVSQPFGVTRVYAADPGRRGIEAVFPLDERLEQFAGRAIGLPLVPLDAGQWLWSISDLGSDRRLVVRFDSELSLVNATLMDVSLAFVAADTVARTLVAARNAGKNEVVLYRWRR